MFVQKNCIALDFETYSDVDLRSCGLDNYVNGEHFRVLLAAVYYLDKQNSLQSFVLDFVENYDSSFRQLEELVDVSFVIAQNAGFEHAVLNAIGIDTPISKMIDSAVLARAAGAGSSLEAAAAQLLGEDKVEAGADLIKKFCVPQPMQIEAGDLAFDMWLPSLNRSDWNLFMYYCRVDALLSWKLASLLLFSGSTNTSAMHREIQLSQITMDMNNTGWHVDLDLVTRMDETYFNNTRLIRQNFVDAYNCSDLNLNSSTQLIAWCKERGITVKSFDEKNVASLFKRVRAQIEKMPVTDHRWQGYSEVAHLLRVKQQLGGSSLKKLDVLLKTTSKDGRLRNAYMHVGAGATFRTTGRGVQMQNLKRLHGEGDDVLKLMDGSESWNNDKLASNLRQVFTAANPLGELVVGDFSSVESRALAWQAGEQWKIDAYFRGDDLYKVQAGQMFNVPVSEVTKDQRQIGKVAELACGYGAGPDAVRAFADKMGVDLSDAESAKLVRDWRDANAQVVSYWNRLDSALHAVLEGPHANFGHVSSLPNGEVQFKSVPAPESLRKQTGNDDLKSVELSLFDHDGNRILWRVIHGAYTAGRNVQYWKPTDRKTGDLWVNTFTDPKTKQRRYYSVYGGKLAGLLTQSLCREVFFKSLTDVYNWQRNINNVKLIGQFHDEIVLEWEPSPLGVDLVSVESQLAWYMTRTSLQQFPLGAEIKSAYRYIK